MCVQVLAFYASMGMRLPDKPPLLLVEPSALESAEAREGRHDSISRDADAPVRLPICISPLCLKTACVYIVSTCVNLQHAVAQDLNPKWSLIDVKLIQTYTFEDLKMLKRCTGAMLWFNSP